MIDRCAHGVAVLFGLGVIFAAANAQADPPEGRDAAAADVLFERALELQKSDPPAACALFAASHDLDPTAASQMKIAKCHEREGRLALALRDLEEAMRLNAATQYDEPGRQAELAAHGEKLILELAPRVPELRLVLASHPPGLAAVIDGVPVANPAEGQRLDPGAHHVSVEAPGHHAATHDVTLAERERLALPIELVPVPRIAPAPPSGTGALPPLPAKAPAAPDESSGDAQRIAGITFGAFGLGSLGSAGVLGIVTLVKVGAAKDHCTPSVVCDQEGFDLLTSAATTQTAGFALLGVGSALFATSTAVYLTAPDAAAVAFELRPGGASARVQW